jgi:hypothetical protein
MRHRETLDMQAIKQTEGFRNLDQVTQELVKRLDRDQIRLREDLKVHTERISNNQDHTNELITREHERTRSTILASIQSGGSNRPLRKFQGLPESSEDLDKEEKDLLIESALLASLRFPTMENRFEEIELAHRKTFEWIFRSPKQQSKWSDFPRWLSEGAGIYWINGKAASGKSTLMRFICDNPRTATLLNEWSKRDQLVRATHFFWNSGTADQRSYEGLLRALLFDILRQARHLIRVVFPDRWAVHREHPTKVVHAPMSWTLPRLIKAFDHLFRQANSTLKFCLFVDGLDEYDGDSFDIIDLFTRISKLSNVKLCLSSRPLYDFVKMFRSFPTLRLQDLNFSDIKQYVEDKLGANDQMQELHRKEPELAPKLVLEIIEKADGVFLWVRLVVFSLLRGLRNSDEISDLQRRLRLLPPSLENLFSHMLSRLEPVYLEQSSRIFQIFAACRHAEHPLNSLELSLAEEANAESLLLSRTEPLSAAEQATRVELVNIWLVTRCGGLIEANNIFHDSNDLRHWFLSYLHRTVRDFLELPQVWTRVIGPTRGSDFNPHISLLQCTVLYIKFMPIPRGQGGDSDLGFHRYVAQRLKHAYHAELETNRAEALLVDELDRLMTEVTDTYEPIVGPVDSSIPAKGDGFYDIHDNFLAAAIRSGLYHYVAYRIESQPGILCKTAGRPYLEYAVQERGIGWVFGHQLQLSSKIVHLLLQNGSCPNEIYNRDSAWDSILRRFFFLHCRGRWPRARSSLLAWRAAM